MKRLSAWEIFKSIFLVTAITLLIWLWAEGENVRPYQLNGEITFVGPQGKALILTPQQADPSFTITIRSNVNKREEAKRLLEAGPIEIDVVEDPDQPSVMRNVDLLERLRNNPEFLNAGITISDVRPQSMAVEVERLQDVTLPIRVDTGDIELASPPTLDVTEAVVRVRAKFADTLAGESLLASPDPTRLRTLNVNEPHTFGPVPLTMPATYAHRVEAIEPANVRVTLTIRSQTDRLTLERVTVMTILPASQVGRFNIQLDDRNRFLRNIEISGPTDIINRIRNKEVTVDAVLRFSIEDLETNADRESITWPVYIEPPPNVTVINPPPSLTFKITKLPPPPTGIGEPLVVPALP